MDQILAEQWGSKGSEGSKWIKFSNSCRTMGCQRVGGVEMDQILQFVPNNGGSKGSEGQH